MIKSLLTRLESSSNRRAVIAVAEAVFAITHSVLQYIPGRPRCPVCGALLFRIYRPVFSKQLIDEWKINPQWEGFYNRREGEICLSCGGSIRGRQIGSALVNWINRTLGTNFLNAQIALRDLRVRSLRIAEINSCGGVHKILNALPNVFYSEFEPQDKTIRHENLLTLSYGDESLDIVLHSDTLEHVPDIDRALSEIFRVLKPGGSMIFSVPIVRDGRDTLVRAKLENGEIKHFSPPSYHGGSYQTTSQYLVCYEFGEDFIALLKNHGFTVELLECPDNPAAVTFTAIKHAS
jgi:SAM-dependent methyltransferase